MNYKVAILPILICLLSGCCFQNRTNKVSREASPADSVNETETPIFPKEYQVRYEKPINGFTVTALIEAYEEDDSGPAVLTFKKSDVSFTVLVEPFSKEGFSLKNYYDTLEEILLQYVPKPKGVMLYDKEPFCFSDIETMTVWMRLLFWNRKRALMALAPILFTSKMAHYDRMALSRFCSMNMLNSTPRIRPSRDITTRMGLLNVRF